MNGLLIPSLISTDAIHTENVPLHDLIEKYKEEKVKNRNKLWSLLQPIFHNTQFGISIISGDGRFLELNDRFCQICKRTRQEMSQITWQSITHKDFLEDDIQRAEAEKTFGGSGYIFSKVYLAPDNSNIPVIIEVNAVKDYDSTFLFYIVKAIEIKEILAISKKLEKYS